MRGEATQVKCCGLCGTYKTVEEFYASCGAPDGLQARCKECCKASAKQWQIDNRERARELGRDSYNRDIERSRAYHRRYARQYRAENPERSRAQVSRWQAQNMDKIRTNQRAWIRERYNNDAIFKAAHLLRTRLGGAYRRWLSRGYWQQAKDDVDFEAIFTHMGECPGDYGRGPGLYTIDHIIPIRLLDLTDANERKIAISPRNHRWLLWEDNYKRGQEWTEEVETLYVELKEEIENG